MSARPTYTRPTTESKRVQTWQEWKASLTAKATSEISRKLGKGREMPVTQDLMRLKYAPHKSQARFHASNFAKKGYSGPIGSGKSYALSYESLYLSAISPNCVGYVLAPTFTMLQGAAQKAIFSMLQEEGFVINRDYFYLGGNVSTLTFAAGDPNFDTSNGQLTPSQIVFRTASNPDFLRGPNIAWFGIDELTYAKDDTAWKVMLGRVREPRATQYNAFGCWTPKGYDWVWETFINKPDAKTDMVYASRKDNTHLPEDYYTDMESSYDSQWARQELDGEYLPLFQGMAYHCYSKDHNVKPVSYIPNVPICWSLDFNVTPFSSVLAQYHDAGSLSYSNNQKVLRPYSEVHVFDEIVLRESNTYKMCDEFKDRVINKGRFDQLSGERITVHIYGDATGARDQTSSTESDWDIIRKFFLANNNLFNVKWFVGWGPNNGQNPPVKARVNAVNAALLSAQGIRRLKVNPKCDHLIKDLQMVAWKPGNIGSLDPGKKKELTHISDALGYFVVKLTEFQSGINYMRERINGF